MIRPMLALLCATLLVFQPVLALAQVTSFNARTGAVVPSTGDYTCALVKNCAPLTGANTWTAQQVMGLNPIGTVSPRTNLGLQIVGPGPGENNIIDTFAYNGWSQIVVERYDFSGGHFTAVQSGEVVGGLYGAAFTGRGDPVDAGVFFQTTETQDFTHNGMQAVLAYTANASTALRTGLAVSPHGNGGVTVGDEALLGAISDLGNGAVHAGDSIATGNHFIAMGGQGTVTACGASPAFNAGTDQAGAITTGGSVTSCKINFAKPWGSAPVCMVQLFNAATPTPFISSELTTSITVSFPAAFSGKFQFLCMGVPG